MMWDGKKNTSQRIFYGAMDKIKERTADDPLKLFKKAVENAKPLLEVKTRRVGGKLSGSGGGFPEPPGQSGDSLDSAERPQQARQGHAGQVGERVDGCRQHARWSD